MDWVEQALQSIRQHDTGGKNMVNTNGEKPADGQREYVVDQATGTYRLMQYQAATDTWQPIPESTLAPEAVSETETATEDAADPGPAKKPADVAIAPDPGPAPGPASAVVDSGVNNQPEPTKVPVWEASFPAMTRDGHAVQAYVYSDHSVRLTPDD